MPRLIRDFAKGKGKMVGKMQLNYTVSEKKKKNMAFVLGEING